MKYKIVDAGFVKAHVEDMPIVDVRPEFMYEEARIPGAVSIPYMTWLTQRNAAMAAETDGEATSEIADGAADAGATPEVANAAPEAIGEATSGLKFGDLFKAQGIHEDTPVIVYCHSGMLAHEACKHLYDEGFSGLHCYEGSWVDWISDPDNPTDDRALPSA